jgi:hypothetical protein
MEEAAKQSDIVIDKQRIEKDRMKYGAVTISGAVQTYMNSDWLEQDLSYIFNCSEDSLDKLYSNYCPFFMRVCALKKNKTLRVRCGSGVDISPGKAAKVLVKALWKYMQGTPIDQLDKLDIRLS